MNGKIAKADGSVEWLESIPNPGKSDYGYYDFYNSIDTTVQGYNTYKQIVDWDIDFPYADKKNYVLTRKQDLTNNKNVDFVKENPLDFIKNLKREKGKDIWLIGGGQINTLFLNALLIDEIHLHVMPIVISDGITLFEHIPEETTLKLISSKNYASGVVELKYSL